MIDLSKFSTVRELIGPVVNGWGQVAGRKIWEPKVEDGWYLLKIGDKIEVVRKATPMEILKTLRNQKVQRVYAFGNEGIPINFDAFEKQGFKEAEIVQFLNLPVFEVAKVVLWEDGRFYFYEADVSFQRSLLRTLKEKFEKEESTAGVKGITPEMAYYLLLTRLEQQAYREADRLLKMKLSKEERDKRIQQFQNTFEGRLKHAIEQGGGELVKFAKSNKSTYLVEWKIGGQTVKSTIRDNMQIMSAGFCLSGADKDHTMTSIVHLARMFQTTEINEHLGEARLYITRD